MSEIGRVGVIGCGVMGRGISQVCATYGYEVTIIDPDRRQLHQGLTEIKSKLSRNLEKKRLTKTEYEGAIAKLKKGADLDELASSDIIIESAVEDISVKKQLFTKLGRLCKKEAILASNTSSISIATLAEASTRTGQVIGLHFFNPPTTLPLIELITCAGTSPATIKAATTFCASIDRHVVRVKDSPGFIVNRLLIPFLFEAMRLVEAGIATADDIDRACQEGLGHTMGPFATSDLIGLDTLTRIGESILGDLNEPQYQPPKSLRQLVKTGNLGRKSGSGFVYNASTPTADTLATRNTTEGTDEL